MMQLSRRLSLAAFVIWSCASTTLSAAQGGGESETTGYDGGFYVRSDDGRRELVLEGLFQVVFTGYESSRARRADVSLKRFRPELAGKLDWMRFRFEPKFDEEGVELEEAWVGAQMDNALLQIGRMKVPFGLEEVRSRRFIDFPVFSIVNQFSPAEEHGLFVHGTSSKGTWEYGASLTEGLDEGPDDGVNLAARAMVHPFREREGSAWRNLQVGAAVTWGEEEASLAGDSVLNAAHLPVVRYADTLALDGDRWRADLEAAWYDGPWMVQGEVLGVSEEMAASGVAGNVSTRGAYVTVSRALTGEDKSFRGVDPAQAFDFGEGAGGGAWVAALRLSQLDLDDDLAAPGFAVPGTFTDRIRSASVALNWYPNRHGIVRTALIYSDYGAEVALDGGTADDEVSVLMEVQMHF